MAFSLEPFIVREWLAPLHLDLNQLLAQPAKYQADIIRFLIPDEGSLTEQERSGLGLIGWVLGQAALAEDKPSKTLLGTLFDMYLAIKEPAPAEAIFGWLYPEPETMVT